MPKPLNNTVQLVLASGSKSRQEMLSQAGYDFNIMPADIREEDIIEQELRNNILPKQISAILAKEKAKYISQSNQENYIIGSDQILAMNGKIFSKAKNRKEARDRLVEFQGKSHYLFSSVSVYKNEKELFSFTDQACLKMNKMSVEEIEKYCDKATDSLTSCVGCYALESIGIRLFEKVEGNYFTILGMPLLPLIQFLNEEGYTL